MTPFSSPPVDSTEELAKRLAIASALLAADLATIAPAARAAFASHLPQMEPPEDDILRRHLFEQEPIQRIAASLQLPETDVLGWATLAMIRLLPDMPLEALLQSPTVVDRSANLG
jgi:hypothetical protein